MGRRAQRRREARDLAKHVLENQVEPQMAAQRLRERGIPVETGFVNLNPNAEGFTVTCTDCGRTAKLATDPGQKVAVCPNCVRERGLM